LIKYTRLDVKKNQFSTARRKAVKNLNIHSFSFPFLVQSRNPQKRRIEFAIWKILMRLHFSTRRLPAASRKGS